MARQSNQNPKQAEPVQGATVLDHVKKQVYNTAKARHDNVIKMRDKLVNKMLSTLKNLKHESIRPIFHLQGDYPEKVRIRNHQDGIHLSWI